MAITEHSITVTRSARYYLLGEIGSETTEVWFVLHGYMYLAREFIRYFKVLEDPKRLIVAPEGLSRAYLDHKARRVGASWMTRENREAEISDYVNYLDDLYRGFFWSVDRSSVIVHVLGFSQGAATACRWVAQGTAEVDRLTIWAGLVPPDLDLAEDGRRLRDAKLTVVLGDRDEWVDSTVADRQEKRLREVGVLHELLRYSGGHSLKQELLLQLAQALLHT